MRLIIVFILIFSFTILFAQKKKIGIIDLDTIYIQIGFLEKNNSVLQNFKSKFGIKDSLMVMAFRKNCEEYARLAQYTDWSFQEVEKRRKKLEEEQSRIQNFEKSLNDAIVVLEKELKNWSEDYIRKEIRFEYYSQDYKAILIKKETLFMADEPKYITNLIIEAMRVNNEWGEALDKFIQFILNKVTFDFQLD